MITRKRTIALGAVVLVALLAAALLAASCGSSTTGKSSAGTGSAAGSLKTTGKAEIDNFLKQLDQQMNSVNENDYGDNQLSNSQLGY